jgi:hypothetical protein
MQVGKNNHKVFAWAQQARSLCLHTYIIYIYIYIILYIYVVTRICTCSYKGPESVRLSWVKGHATQDHIDRGISDGIRKAGNDTADANADIGAELHGKY